MREGRTITASALQSSSHRTLRSVWLQRTEHFNFKLSNLKPYKIKYGFLKFCARIEQDIIIILKQEILNFGKIVFTDPIVLICLIFEVNRLQNETIIMSSAWTSFPC